MDSIDKLSLRERTRRRNESIWASCGFGGLMTPVRTRQDVINLLSGAGIENYMAISDETWAIKEYERDKTYELEQFSIQQDYQIANEKAATERAKLAIKIVTDALVLSVMEYDAAVKALIMSAREFAAQVELEQLALARQQAALDIIKEGLRLKQANTAIMLEYFNQRMVDVEIARAKVDVAKAQVRAIMADIEAGEAEIKLLDAQIEVLMAEADKAGLQADVATIYAQIMVKQLSQVKLDVGQAEIAAGFAYLAVKLADMVALYDEKKVQQQIQVDLELALRQELYNALVAEQASEDLKETQQLNNREVLDYTSAATWENVAQETALKAVLAGVRNAISDARLLSATSQDGRKTWAQRLETVAHKWAYLNGQAWHTDITRDYQYIKGD